MGSNVVNCHAASSRLNRFDNKGNEFLITGRKQLNWLNHFYDNFKQHLKPPPSNCPRCDKPVSQKQLQLDHIVPFHDLLKKHCDLHRVCIAYTDHWDVYVVAFADDTLDVSKEIVMFQEKRRNSVSRVYHTSDNLEWLCGSCNASKNGTKNPHGLALPDYWGSCPGKEECDADSDVSIHAKYTTFEKPK